jgi:hypothetical protein
MNSSLLSVIGASAKTMLEFEVLYFQRSNKVHKTKGVSKFDGILTINVATGAIQLKDSACAESDGESCDDDDEDDCGGNKRKKKQSYAKKQKQRKKTNSISYSGTDKSLAQRAEQDLRDDETVMLGGFQVQIVSCRSSSGVKLGQTKMIKTIVTQSLQSQRRPSMGLISRNQSSSNPMKQRVLVAKPLISAKAKPVAGKVAITSGQPPLKREPLLPVKLQQLAPLHPRPGHFESRSAGLSQQQSQSTATECTVCPEIPLTGQIRNALRPHQIEGVEFLWKALVTGLEKGAILADEMVSKCWSSCSMKNRNNSSSLFSIHSLQHYRDSGKLS